VVAAPCARLIEHPAIDDAVKEQLCKDRSGLDPLELFHSIRKGQAALAASSSDDPRAGPGRENLDQFLAKLP
jgi:hypothetical protein